MAGHRSVLRRVGKWCTVGSAVFVAALIALFIFHSVRTGVASVAWMISEAKNYHSVTPAMEPNFNPGEHMMARLRTSSGGFPSRGTVLVVRNPLKPEQDWVRRLVGLPFDRVAINDGVLYVNGSAVAEEDMGPAGGGYRLVRETLPGGHSHLIKVAAPDTARTSFGEISVPAGQMLLLADNRDGAKDSRHAELGLVPLDNIIGVAKFIYLSPDLSRLGATIE
ncbi:signal peptidase I [Nisaea sediminum]|uniref:signal peptidase I n=1 Tax=Nisaea sediminum TaxID=2775867 RepID=UPI0018681170|nr:signal peptidase I [Nisaea sediminum]